MPVALIALFGLFGTYWTLLTVTDRFQPVRRDPQLNQKILGRRGPAIAQAEIVLCRAALVAVTFDHDLETRVVRENLLQRGSILRQRLLRIRADVELVKIEVRVLHL